MIKRLMICKSKADEIKSKSIKITDTDIAIMWHAMRQGFITMTFIREIILKGNSCVSYLSERLDELVANDYLRKIRYTGPKYGSKERKDSLAFLPTSKAYTLFGVGKSPERIGKNNAFIAYYIDNAIRAFHRCGIDPYNIFTSLQVKKRSSLIHGKDSFLPDVRIRTWERNSLFHLVIPDSQGSFIYIYFLPDRLKLGKITGKRLNRPLKQFMSLIEPGEKVFLVCYAEQYKNNLQALLNYSYNPALHLTTFDSLIEVITPLITDPVFYRSMLKRDFGACLGMGFFYTIPVQSDHAYITETLSCNMAIINNLLAYQQNRNVHLLCHDYQQELFQGKKNFKLYIKKAGDIDNYYNQLKNNNH